MRPFDIVAWAEALGVGERELPWALASRVRLVEELHAELTKLRVGMAEVPDEGMLASISSASRADSRKCSLSCRSLTMKSRPVSASGPSPPASKRTASFSIRATRSASSVLASARK